MGSNHSLRRALGENTKRGENFTKMNEVLDVIFTHEKGQSQMTIPLILLQKTGAFQNKAAFEANLVCLFEGATSFRAVGSAAHKASGESPQLVKISTCIYTETDFLPDWYGDWDGKFYYSL